VQKKIAQAISKFNFYIPLKPASGLPFKARPRKPLSSKLFNELTGQALINHHHFNFVIILARQRF
jgi:hypothetical protein